MFVYIIFNLNFPIPLNSERNRERIYRMLRICPAWKNRPAWKYLCEYYDRICGKWRGGDGKTGLWKKGLLVSDGTAEKSSHASRLHQCGQPVCMWKIFLGMPEEGMGFPAALWERGIQTVHQEYMTLKEIEKNQKENMGKRECRSRKMKERKRRRGKTGDFWLMENGTIYQCSKNHKDSLIM